jgi:ssDNA-binding Zn-finger/Zn-ribbon topoisomerase 1
MDIGGLATGLLVGTLLNSSSKKQQSSKSRQDEINELKELKELQALRKSMGLCPKCGSDLAECKDDKTIEHAFRCAGYPECSYTSNYRP